jgi:hypothetical protein
MHALALTVMLALAAAPKGPQKTQLKIEVKPASTVVFVDGKRKGTGAKPITLSTTPGRHMIKLVFGKDEHQEAVQVKSGETKKWTWAFEDDRPDKRAKVEEPTDEGGAAPEDKGGGEDDGPPPDEM